MEKVFTEYYNVSKEQFLQLMSLFENPHDFLILNLKHNRIFYDFDEVII